MGFEKKNNKNQHDIPHRAFEFPINKSVATSFYIRDLDEKII